MLKVLIVEDEELLRKGLIYTTDWFSMGCVVVGDAANGIIGLEKIRELKPDLVITDIRMPKMTGLEMIKHAKEDYSLFFCSIILSSYSEFEYARISIQLGVFEYILKPIDEDELRKIIARAASVIGERKNNEIVSRMPSFVFTTENLYVKKVIDQIRSGYMHKLTIESVAESLKVSVSYLSRKLKQETAASFVELLNRYRVIKSAELLSSGQYRIYEICEKTGFSDYKYFCSVFKKYTGYPPSSLVQHKIP